MNQTPENPKSEERAASNIPEMPPAEIKNGFPASAPSGMEKNGLQEHIVNTGNTPPTPPAKPVHPDDRSDADNKEIWAYVLGGIAGRIADSDMFLKQNLMMFVLRLNPMLIALSNVIGFIWDAITDPIMANITDNSRNRWGRRRPFILVGGILSALFSIVIWYYCPRTDKTEKNVPDIPEVIPSDDALIKFGEMLTGYGFTDLPVQLQTGETPAATGLRPAEDPKAILAKAIKKMKGPVRLGDKPEPGALTLGVMTTGFGATASTADPVGLRMCVHMELDGTTVTNVLTIENEYPQKRGFFTIAEDKLKLRHGYLGFHLDGEGIDIRHNAFRNRAVESARVAVIEKSLIEALGERFGLPYWKCFPLQSDDGDLLRQEVALARGLQERTERGIGPADARLYQPLLDQILISIEKRRKYNFIKTALANKALDPEASALIAAALPNTKDREEVARSIAKGWFSQVTAPLVNKKVLDVKLAEAQQSRERLKKQLGVESDFDLFLMLHSKLILYGLGQKMDMLTPGFSAEEKAIATGLLPPMAHAGLAQWHSALWNLLETPLDPAKAALRPDTWGTPKLQMAAVFLKRLSTPSFQGKAPGMMGELAEGMKAFGKNAQDDKVAIYLMLMAVVFATFKTINGVPYYALGIELAPSYNGRTKVVAYRSVMEKIIAIKNPWLFPLVLLPIFSDAIVGTMWVGIVAAVISIPMLIYSVTHTRERIKVDRKKKKISFFSSVNQTVRVPEFWRILILNLVMSKIVGVFNMVGGYLTIYYVFGGSLLKGASYQALVGSFATLLALISVPFVAWMCNKYQKHNALRFAIVLMMIGTVLKWWCVNPEHPELLFVIPFFYSIGISSLYTVLSTLMADVTDADELRNGTRREGMFGAVNAMISKFTHPLSAIIASLVVVLSGFDVDAGPHQVEGVFLRMRILFSFVPAVLMGLALLLLYKYPLTRQRMEEIKAEIRRRREAETAG